MDARPGNRSSDFFLYCKRILLFHNGKNWMDNRIIFLSSEATKNLVQNVPKIQELLCPKFFKKGDVKTGIRLSSKFLPTKIADRTLLSTGKPPSRIVQPPQINYPQIMYPPEGVPGFGTQ